MQADDLSGRRVMITGASRGIGAEAARAFAQAGARVALTARSAEAVETIAREIRAGGGEALALPADVADRDAMAAATRQVVESWGGVDVLVANAGVIDPIAPLDKVDPAAWDRLIDINVKGVFHAIRAVLPVMLAAGGGTVITVGSGAAERALEGWSAYCSSKAAVHHLARCLDHEMRGKGIRSLVLSPGTVATDMQRRIRESGINPVSRMDWSDHVPPAWPARALVWMTTAAADPWLGEVVHLSDPAVQAAIGLGGDGSDE